MKVFKELFVVSLVAVNCVSCQQGEGLRLQHRSGLFTYYALDCDSSAVRDICALMDSASPAISKNLDVQYKSPISVEVYPDQDAYNDNVMSPQMRGTPAVSGSYRIQMVSPNSPIAIQGIPYQERLWFAVHEFTHLVVDEVSNEVPLWLDEGLACYEGSRVFYSYVCLHSFPKRQMPTLATLEQSYNHIPAADVYSFSLVEFLIHRFGRAKVNQLVRHPQNPEKVFNVADGDIYQEWKKFVSSRYAAKTQ